jgi:hypothetical protein
LAKGSAFEQLHCDERQPIGFVNLVDSADAGVIEGRGGTSLAAESLQRVWVCGEIFWKELQGDVPSESQIFSFIHHTHPPASDLTEDAIVGNSLPYGFRRYGHWRQ